MQDTVTFRPRSGYTNTLGTGTTATVAVPAGTRQAIVTCTATAGRVLVSGSPTPPTVDATSFGYLVANIPMTIKFGGYDTHVHLASTVAGNTFYVTFGL